LLLAFAPACAVQPGHTGSDTSEMPGTDDTGESTGTDDTAEDTTEGESGDPEPLGNLFLSDKLLNIAHRGGGHLRPESTLLAFEHALSVGADVLEMDLHATADGVIVVLHDTTVDRTTDGSGAVAELDFAELRMLDAGYAFTTDGGQTYPYRGMGVVIPTLDEVLDAFPDSYFLLEIKQHDPPIVDPVLALLAEHEIDDRVVLASFSHATILAVREANPAMFTAMAATEMVEFVEMLGDPEAPEYLPPCQFVQSPWEITTQEFVDRAHELGMKVHPWTVNTGPLMSDLIGRGVDGIMTDDPALLHQVAGN
jgi:glycerophosphoryl diester phosphodiesterase